MRSKCIAVIALAAALAAPGCHKRTPVVVFPPQPATPPSAPVSPLDQPNRAFISENYDDAARGYEDYLQTTSPGTGLRDQALFHLALIYASKDWTLAATKLNQLIGEYRNSPLTAPAKLILSLHDKMTDEIAENIKQRDQRDQRIKQLITELDRLKKIDADRRKRP